MANVYQIEKLDGKNFPSWKLQMKMMLIHSELWEFVSGVKLKPTGTDITELSEFDRKDQKALATIVLGIKASELIHVKNCETSREAWQKLTEIYQPKGPATKVSLTKQLVQMRKRTGQTMSDHLNNFFETVDRLAEIGAEVPKEFLSVLLLCSLPEEYENFRVAIESRDSLPEAYALKTKLLEEETRRMEKDTEKQNCQSAYATKTRKKKSWEKPKYAESKPFPFKCHKCGIKGHKAAECKNKEKRYVNENTSLVITSKSAALNLNNSESAPILHEKEWCFDSGATSHMCSDKIQFTCLKPLSDQKVQLANMECTDVKGKGTVKLKIVVNSKLEDLLLEDVLYVPELQGNLISVSKATQKPYDFIFRKDRAWIRNANQKVVVEAVKRNGLYILNQPKVTAAMAAQNENRTTKANMNDITLWHRRYGHLNLRDLKKLQDKEMVYGLSIVNSNETESCEICFKGKQTRLPFPKESLTVSKNSLDLVHTDICGPIRKESLGGAKYFITFIDDKTRKITMYTLKHRSEALQAFKKYKAMAEKQTGHNLKVLRSDNAQEFVGKEFQNFLESEGIQRQFSVEYTPQQNGIAERANRTLVEMARCMLIEANLPESLWAEMVLTATYIRNRCPTSNREKTPEELWSGRKPGISHLRIIGSKAFAMNNKPQKSKFSPRSEEYILVGYSEESKAYRLWKPGSKSISNSRDVRFIEPVKTEVTKDDSQTNQEYSVFDFELQNTEIPVEEVNKQESIEEASEESDVEIDESIAEDSTHTLEQSEHEEKRLRGRPKLLKTGKPGRPKKLYHTSQVQETEKENKLPDPETVKEALSRCESKAWKNAMQEEYTSLQNNDTWDLVDLPKHRTAIGSRWVFRTKRRTDGTIERYKARLVAKGYAQKHGTDYTETFSPVVRYSSIRTLIALAVEYDLKVHQMDVLTAYLNGELEEEIYMQQPEFFISRKHPNKVCRLKKSLYGLKQAGRAWYIKLDEKLKELGLKRLESDNCLYIKREQGNIIIIAVYVDDLIIMTRNEKDLNNIKSELGKCFKMRDLGEIDQCLGMKIERNSSNKSMSICQTRYIEELLTKYGMENAKPISTPLDPNIKLSKNPPVEAEAETVDINEYQSLIGSLMHLAVCTRPDIAYSVSSLSQFCSNPKRQHWNSAKRVLRYLHLTKRVKLVYKKTGNKLCGYVDADWGGNIDDRKSYSGVNFNLAGGAITWESRKQKLVALSSTEAEYVAFTNAAKEAVYLRLLLKELGFEEKIQGPTVIFNDNQSAQQLIKNPVYHSRTKHIDIRYHYIRNIFEQNEIDVMYLSTQEMPADVLTKSLPRSSHQKCMIKFGLTLSSADCA